VNRVGTEPEVLEIQMAEAASLLAETVAPVAPGAAVKGRLMSRVAAWQSLKPLADLHPYDSPWMHGGAPGVEIRQLFRDGQTGRSTMLVRMEPGATFPAHHHADDEQCYVLKGDIRWGDVVYEEGDFVVMAKNTTHPEIRSVTGNLLLIIAGKNEFVHA
jgi:anti-sigma factor ChrR (cupin superfamily)